MTPAQTGEESQEVLKKLCRNGRGAALPDHAKDKPIEIWFQDEARIGQQGTLTRVWAKRGTRSRAPRDQRYDTLSALMAHAVISNEGAGRPVVRTIASIAVDQIMLRSNDGLRGVAI
jgi:hypothetical protein